MSNKCEHFWSILESVEFTNKLKYVIWIGNLKKEKGTEREWKKKTERNEQERKWTKSKGIEIEWNGKAKKIEKKRP